MGIFSLPFCDWRPRPPSSTPTSAIILCRALGFDAEAYGGSLRTDRCFGVRRRSVTGLLLFRSAASECDGVVSVSECGVGV
eukprot:67915-Prorocentrum_minimum.AAC.1